MRKIIKNKQMRRNLYNKIYQRYLNNNTSKNAKINIVNKTNVLMKININKINVLMKINCSKSKRNY